nr:hypothetical protein [Proteus mirabilis]
MFANTLPHAFTPIRQNHYPFGFWIETPNRKLAHLLFGFSIEINAAKPCRYWHKARFGTFCTLNQPRHQSTNRLIFKPRMQTIVWRLDFFTWQMPPNSAVLDDVFQTVSRTPAITKNRFDWLV